MSNIFISWIINHGKRTKAEALKTRQELIETAIAQFAQHGVSKTTLNDIADAANVTRGAIYWHFENKTQLFNEMWLQQPSLRELIRDHLTAGLEHDPFQQLREKIDCRLAIYCQNSPPAGVAENLISQMWI